MFFPFKVIRISTNFGPRFGLNFKIKFAHPLGFASDLGSWPFPAFLVESLAVVRIRCSLIISPDSVHREADRFQFRGEQFPLRCREFDGTAVVSGPIPGRLP